MNDGKHVVLGLYEALASGDVAAFTAAIHEDFRIEGPGLLPWGGIHQGREAVVAEVLMPLARAIDLGSARIESLYGEGDRVFATIVATATGGEPVLIGEDWTLRDGRPAAVRVFWFDPTPLMSAVRPSFPDARKGIPHLALQASGDLP